jgi:hypothetical protein
MFFVNDPGPWQSFILRGDNVGKPINEVTQKYLNEQLQFENFISMEQQLQLQQYQNKGILASEINNYITSVNFGGDELETISGFNDAQIIVTFDRSVEVTGTPYISASNQQQGEGERPFTQYDYSSGSGTNTLVFVYQQGAAVTNTQSYVGAYALDETYNGLPTTATDTLSNCEDGVYAVTGTWSAGGVAGDTSGGNVSNINITIVSNAVTNINFSDISYTAGKRFTPGNKLTILGSSITGAGGEGEGSGNYVFDIQTSMLLGDVNGLTGTAISLNGGTITNTEGGNIDLTYTETDTKTAIAS